MSDEVMYLAFYAFILVAAVVAAYLKLIPLDFLMAVFGIVAGNGGASLPSLISGPTPMDTIPPPDNSLTSLHNLRWLGNGSPIEKSAPTIN